MRKVQNAEELVFEEGTAEREAGVVVADLLLGGREGAFVAEELVAVVVVGGAVEGVGARAEGEIDGAARVATAFGAGLGLSRELVDRVQREDNAGDPGDTPLIDGRNVVPEIVVVDAVDLPVHLVGAGAVHGAVAAAGVAGVAGGEADHLGEVAAVEGDVVDFFGVENGVLGDGGGIECDGRGVDFNDGVGAGACDLQLDGKRVDDAGRDHDLVGFGGVEAAGADKDGVGAEGKVLKEEVSG